MTKVTPRPLGASKSAVFSFAEQVARHVGYTAGASMQDLVTKLRGRISYHDTVNPQSRTPESIVVQPDREFCIFLPTVTTVERDRFTIAHELGHLFLHFPKAQKDSPGSTMVAFRWVDDQDPSQKRAEWEANWFAAAFVMPADEFGAFYRANSLSKTASHFGVSQSAASVRAKSLGV